jgi:hypothetical protein
MDRIFEFYCLEKDFSPCVHCANIFTDECVNECTPDMKYEHFRLRDGTGIKDLEPFPIDDIMNFPDPSFRLVVISIYLAAITDYLQHEEEYKFREQAPNMKKKVPDNYTFVRRIRDDYNRKIRQSDDDPASS